MNTLHAEAAQHPRDGEAPSLLACPTALNPANHYGNRDEDECQRLCCRCCMHVGVLGGVLCETLCQLHHRHNWHLRHEFFRDLLAECALWQGCLSACPGFDRRMSTHSCKH